MSRPTLTVLPGGSSEPTDGELLQGVSVGDPHAATAFVQRHQQAVLRFVSRMIGAHDPMVEDLTQLAFVAALDSARTFTGAASGRTWLLGIAHNKVRMEIRTRMRRRRALAVLRTIGLVKPQSAPPSVDANQTARRIQEAINTLGPNPRAAFVLCEIEGYTAQEAAESLGVPSGTVRRWMTESRRTLRPILADLMPGGTP